MRNLKLIVQYDGTDFAGFQKQPHAVTIQGELERALAQVLQENVRTIGASRTDAGVHARGQVVAFRTGCAIPAHRLANALNNALPAAIRVVEACDATPEFHPRYDALGKWYTYRIINRAHATPFEARYGWHLRTPLDTRCMSLAAQRLLGRHDFSAFAVSGSDVQDKVRTLHRLECLRDGDTVTVHSHADGYLYMMVRSIVGTLVEVGLGELRPERVTDILASGDRSQAGPTAPPQGLCLERVEY